MKTLSQVLKEFIELFGDGNGGIIGREIIINKFLTISLEELLEQVVPEEYEYPKNDRENVFNICRQEVEDRIRKIVNN